jgi:hypothetical protein
MFLFGQIQNPFVTFTMLIMPLLNVFPYNINCLKSIVLEYKWYNCKKVYLCISLIYFLFLQYACNILLHL